MKEKINADFLSAQKYWERQSEDTRLRNEQELGRLRQQIYILEAKVRSARCDEPGVVSLLFFDAAERRGGVCLTSDADYKMS